MKRTVLIFLMSAGMISCQPERDKVDDLEAEVLQVHDEVMPKMEEMVSLNARLSKKINQLDSLQNEGITGNNLAQDRAKITSIVKKLDESDSLMMEWMHGYNGDSAKKLDTKKALIYFEAEKVKIDKVKLITDKSIEEARLILE